MIVQRHEGNAAGVFSYEITFPANKGDISQLSPRQTALIGAGGTVSVTTQSDGSFVYLGGYFTLDFQGESTKSIQFDATADTFHSLLEELTTVGSISVTRSPPPANNKKNRHTY